MKKILVTGGAGYIGSHCSLELANAGYDVVVLDNLSNSNEESLARVSGIVNRHVDFIKGDIRDLCLLENVFANHDIHAVMHFAGLKAVGESVEHPNLYYDNNVNGTLTLLNAMCRASIFKLVFSSSATVYGYPQQVPISEDHPAGVPTNPYGKSKLMIEQIIEDFCTAQKQWSVAMLRYFNPIGAHESGLIGEDPNGIPNNLVPYITQVAVGKLNKLAVFGGDYPTHDGTGVRDYIHVVDLAKGHLAALYKINHSEGCHVWNLGTGQGYSVLDVINEFEKVSGVKVPYEVVARRSGDIAECWSNPQKANLELDWIAERNLTHMMQDTWRWQKNNPNGYEC